MEKVAFIYSGQGAQHTKMGWDILKAYPEYNELFSRAEKVLGYDLKEIIYEGGKTLDDTRFTQPALFVVEVMLTKILQKAGIQPSVAAGLSLGEYSALVGAKKLSFIEGLALVARRGQVMSEAVQCLHEETGMAAIIGAQPADIISICRTVSNADLGFVGPTNFNSPMQTVISGTMPAMAAVEVKLKDKVRCKVIPLGVSGPFHTPLMAKAAQKFDTAVQETHFSDSAIPVYSNVTGKIHEASSIKAHLVQQMYQPVQWYDIIKAMHQVGINTFVEVGPGKVLSRLVKQAIPKSCRFQTGKLTSLEETIAHFQEADSYRAK